MDDKISLKGALQGGHTVFAVSNYWEKMDVAVEVQQGKNVTDAAKVCPLSSFPTILPRRLSISN